LNVLKYFYLKQDVKVPTYLHGKIPELVKVEALKPYPAGPCYLLNVDKLLRESKSPNNTYNYIELASMRNIFDYSLRGINHLPKIMVPEYLQGLIEVNPLLEDREDNIYFKYEQE